MVEDGYEFFAKRQLVTLFSAPNYCGEFDNAGGMMSVDETLMCSFQVSIYAFTAMTLNALAPETLRMVRLLSVVKFLSEETILLTGLSWPCQ